MSHPAIPAGVGPHDGHELDLMLSGQKHVAIFSDILPDDGPIDEAIIPEKAFAPHVAAGTFKRFQREFTVRNGQTLRTVCFSRPDHVWRCDFLFWLRAQLHEAGMTDDAMDIVEGRILGYSEDDITAYIRHKHSYGCRICK